MEKLTKEELHKLKEKLLKTEKHYEKIISQKNQVKKEKEKLIEIKEKISEKLQTINKMMDDRELKINKALRITVPSLATILGIVGSIMVIKTIFTITIITKAITFVIGAGLSLGLIAGIAKLTKDFIDKDLNKIIVKYNKPLLEKKKKFQEEKKKIKSKIRDLEEDNELLDCKKNYLEDKILEMGNLLRKGKKNYNSEIIKELVEEQASKAKSIIKNKTKIYKK